MKILALLFAGFLTVVGALAQTGSPEKPRYAEKEPPSRKLLLEFAPGAAYFYQVDTRMESAAFDAFGTGGTITLREIGPRGVWNYDAYGYYGELVPSHGNSRTTAVRGGGGITHLRNLNTEGKWQWRLGGRASFLYQLRDNPSLGNSSINQDIVASLNLAGEVRRYLEFLGKKSQLDLRAFVPLLSHVNRKPAYSLSSSTFAGNANYWFVPIGRFNRLNFEAGFTLPIGRGGNQLRLAYAWDFYAFNEYDGLHKLRIAQHSLLLGLATRLN